MGPEFDPQYTGCHSGSRGREETGIPQTHWPTVVTELLSFRCRERACLKTEVRCDWRGQLTFPLAHIHTRTQFRTVQYIYSIVRLIFHSFSAGHSGCYLSWFLLDVGLAALKPIERWRTRWACSSAACSCCVCKKS